MGRKSKAPDNVVVLPVITRLDCPPRRVIKAAADAGLTEVVILGFDRDGDFYFASNKANGPDVLWLLEMAKKKLMELGGA